MHDNRSYTVVLVIALLLLGAGAYLGSYLALVQRVPTFVFGLGPRDHHVTYKRGGVVAEWLFYPVHRIDRLCRPDYWSVNPGKIAQLPPQKPSLCGVHIRTL